MVCSNAPAENEGGADSAYAGLVVIANVSGSAGGFIHEARYGSEHELSVTIYRSQTPSDFSRMKESR